MAEYNILMGGRAGQGSRRAGLTIANLLNHLGYSIFIYDDYQSLVRGGHSFSRIRASEKEIKTQGEKLDILLCLDEETFLKHKGELKKEGIVIYNKDKISNGKGIGIPIETIAKELGGKPIMANTALVSAFAKAAGIDLKDLEAVLKKEFKKAQSVNLKIAKKAYLENEKKIEIKKIKRKTTPLFTGNEALSLGASKAGLEMYYAYPMTPATSVLHFLAEKDLGVQTVQLENEISVIMAALGSAYSGKRTMVGTSGGGFALMSEAISFSAMAEIPVVIMESQRAGPATGVPTYSGQADLNFVLNAGHGDIVKFTVAPGDIDECFYWGGKLLNLSWKYQTPSVLLLDKELSESTGNLKLDPSLKKEEALLWNKKGEYLRYKDTKNGISPLAFPGGKALVRATSYEHNEYGFTVEDEASVFKMQEKRLRKFEAMQKEVDKIKGAVKVFGNKKSDIALIAWGSSKGAVVEAAENMGLKALQIIVLEPFPLKQVLKELEGVKRMIVVEQNALGQLDRLLLENGIEADEVILKYDSRPILRSELEEKLRKIL